jgi:hypothetical protein
MLDGKLTVDKRAGDEVPVQHQAKDTRPVWEAPRLEDVSEQVMAQPYIRFT